MLTKICKSDLKSGILCPRCEKRVKNGEISKLDLEVARILQKMEGKYPFLQKIFFHKAIGSGNTLVILVNKGDVKKILSYGGKILKEISEKTHRKKIKILATNEELRQFLEDLFAPASILTINKIWLPDGSTETKAVIPKKDEKKIPINTDALKELAKSIRNITLRIEIEDTHR